MPANTIRFTPDLLDSYSKLQGFLVGSETDEKVENQVLEAGENPPSNWLNGWNVLPHVVVELYTVIYGAFAKAVSCMLFYSGFKERALKLDILASLALRDEQSIAREWFGKDFLAPSINAYSPEALELYKQARLPAEKIASERVKEVVEREVVKFDENDGFCRGQSLWFIRTCLKTMHLFEDRRKHLQAVGRLFTMGAPQEAALVQKLCLSESVLELSKRPVHNLFSSEKNPPCGAIAEVFKQLDPGAYFLVVPHVHGMAYIATEKGQGFFYDPCWGTIDIHDNAGFHKMAQRIASYVHDLRAKLAANPNKYTSEERAELAKSLVLINKVELL